MAVSWRGFAVAAALVALSLVTVESLKPSAATAGSKPVINTIGSPGIAIKGYDPVAYFEQGGPQKGKSKFTVVHQKARWRFASAENKAKFEANPAKYLPAYGGYCAYGVSQGYLVKIDPNAWSIRDGQLYLNYDKSVQRQWEKRPERYIAKANTRWPKLIGQR
jgi:YHS domain-containing protein